MSEPKEVEAEIVLAPAIYTASDEDLCLDPVPTTGLVVDESPATDPPDGWDAEAEAIMTIDQLAPWMRSLHESFKKLGSKNGYDYKAMVGSAGMKDGVRLWRVKWKAITEIGRKHLWTMAMSFRQLDAPAAQPQKQLEGPKLGLEHHE